MPSKRHIWLLKVGPVALVRPPKTHMPLPSETPCRPARADGLTAGNSWTWVACAAAVAARARTGSRRTVVRMGGMGVLGAGAQGRRVWLALRRSGGRRNASRRPTQFRKPPRHGPLDGVQGPSPNPPPAPRTAGPREGSGLLRHEARARLPDERLQHTAVASLHAGFVVD